MSDNNRLRKQIAPYTITDNKLINDKTLYLRDKGLYLFMMSKPHGWKFSIRGLASQSKEGKDSISSSLKRLITNGWIIRHEIRESGKYTSYEYEIFLKKQKYIPLTASGKSDTLSKKPDTENRI